MTPPVVFAFADPARRTWLALNRAGDAFHIVTPTPDDAQLITDGLRHKGQLSCSCAGGRYRGTCYVTVACEAIESTGPAAQPSGAEVRHERLTEGEPTWFDNPAGAGESVEAFRG
jgi:hypothetical protein